MTHAVASGFRSIIGHRLEAAHRLLASRWLEQLTSLVAVEPNERMRPLHPELRQMMVHMLRVEPADL
ncbi:MAG: hypothetical protein HYU37_03140 [Acidobacteria bacterium]|nr:hypothetical protein [Acidobacteriota bacterium]